MKEHITAYHGTSSAVVKKARNDNRVRGWFDTDKAMCYEYAVRKADRDGSRPVIIEVSVPKKRFCSSWLAVTQKMLGKNPYTSVLSLSWKRYVNAVWTWSTKQGRYVRRRE